ncbi:PREDICTED: WAP four-disulfide core domain protein 18-like [Calidris pugnax]|uniref:WAP four-disulfide core domain protein 18-like n=1 Tax=Calidris pugnax TaxID=198806 RepID=UPI00071D4D41|nr:PREDICTED: WAP four-disulfide core domain protein 18-like [Calidris pugnax]
MKPEMLLPLLLLLVLPAPPLASAKRGSCPQSEPGLITTCDVRCSSDSECPGDMKCCHWGCSIRCMKPVLAKPGVCPRRKVLQTFAPCTNSCRDDSDCPGRTKCCFTGCGLGCLPPNRGRYGE